MRPVMKLLWWYPRSIDTVREVIVLEDHRPLPGEAAVFPMLQKRTQKMGSMVCPPQPGSESKKKKKKKTLALHTNRNAATKPGNVDCQVLRFRAKGVDWYRNEVPDLVNYRHHAPPWWKGFYI